ncbi:MAG: phage tail sheath subtilisin-like domain-containing protein [bacterium]
MLIAPPVSMPGVYVTEVPSGAHPIVGVPTSVTAFLGRTRRGPVNTPVLVTSAAKFDRLFGGLHADSSVGYAVRDFFQEGGSQALVVRLFNDDDRGAQGERRFQARVPMLIGEDLDQEVFALDAASPGSWGNRLKAWVDFDGITAETAAAIGEAGLTSAELFNLHVVLADGRGEVREHETHTAVTLRAGSARALGPVLAGQSALVRFSGASGRLSPTSQTAGVAIAAALDSDPLGISHYDAGLQALDAADIVNLICIPPDVRSGDTPPAVYAAAAAYAEKRRAMVIVDCPAAWEKVAKMGELAHIQATEVGIEGLAGRNAAVYFPRVWRTDPERGGMPDVFPTSGAIAGIYARTDAERGVWKAPAGQQATFSGIDGLDHALTDADNEVLNVRGINALRTFPHMGSVIWGARTLRGADALGDDYRYVPVRRLALYIEESLARGTRWAAFEPNGQALWAQLRQDVGSFLLDLLRQGAFQGAQASDAFFVQCDSTTTTQADIDRGVVNLVVGFAPLKPAEFLVIYLQLVANGGR